MLRILIISISLLFISSCDDKPTLNEMESNFLSNKLVFDDLAQFACALGSDKQPFGPTIDKYSYGTRIENENRIKELDLLLNQIGSTVVNFTKTETGECSLVVGYYVRGFAGSGIGFNYSFQKESPNVAPKNQRTLDNIMDSGKTTIVDIPLSSGWYITFRYS